jgi:hypothetical protein
MHSPLEHPLQPTCCGRKCICCTCCSCVTADDLRCVVGWMVHGFTWQCCRDSPRSLSNELQALTEALGIATAARDALPTTVEQDIDLVATPVCLALCLCVRLHNVLPPAVVQLTLMPACVSVAFCAIGCCLCDRMCTRLDSPWCVCCVRLCVCASLCVPQLKTLPFGNLRSAVMYRTRNKRVLQQHIQLLTWARDLVARAAAEESSQRVPL